MILKYIAHLFQVKVPQSSLQIMQGTSQLFQTITHIIICSAHDVYLFSCVTVDSQLQLLVIHGRKSICEVSPSQQQGSPVIAIPTCTFSFVSCWFSRTWCDLYLNVFQCLTQVLVYRKESKHQNKFLPYGLLQPQVTPAEFVMTFADGWVGLPMDTSCLWLMFKAMSVRFWLLGVVQLRGPSLPELLLTKGCVKHSASSNKIFWLV